MENLKERRADLEKRVKKSNDQLYEAQVRINNAKDDAQEKAATETYRRIDQRRQRDKQELYRVEEALRCQEEGRQVHDPDTGLFS